jgi:hypothetical protein
VSEYGNAFGNAARSGRPGKYETQMQFQMACTGRKCYCDFVSYDPRMPENMRLFIKRVPRDDGGSRNWNPRSPRSFWKWPSSFRSSTASMATRKPHEPRVVPGIDAGSFVPLGMRTSQMTKQELAELIELIYAFGAEQNVKFRELECIA